VPLQNTNDMNINSRMSRLLQSFSMEYSLQNSHSYSKEMIFHLCKHCIKLCKDYGSKYPIVKIHFISNILQNVQGFPAQFLANVVKEVVKRGLGFQTDNTYLITHCDVIFDGRALLKNENEWEKKWIVIFSDSTVYLLESYTSGQGLLLPSNEIKISSTNMELQFQEKGKYFFQKMVPKKIHTIRLLCAQDWEELMKCLESIKTGKRYTCI